MEGMELEGKEGRKRRQGRKGRPTNKQQTDKRATFVPRSSRRLGVGAAASRRCCQLFWPPWALSAGHLFNL